MSIFTNRRNIRVTRPNLMRLISRGIVDRRNINKSGIHTVFSGVPYAYAKRINSISDIEVLLNDNWNFVRNMDYNKLENLYKDELKNKKTSDIIIVKDEIKPEPVVEIKEVEVPIIEKNTEISNNDELEENTFTDEQYKVLEESKEIEESYSEEYVDGSFEYVESISESNTGENFHEAINIENSEEEVQSTDVTYDRISENIKEKTSEESNEVDLNQSISDESEQINSESEEIIESNNINTEEINNESPLRNINNYNFNKPNFKKKKRK
jgi:hypothetical protein